MPKDGYRLPDRIRWNSDHFVANRLTLTALGVLIVGLLLTWLFSSVCGNSSAPAAEPGSSLPSSPTAARTGQQAGTPADLAIYPPETQTGIASVDSLILAVTSADTEAILGRLAYVDVPCTDASNPIPGPGCPPGVAPGTVIQAFPRSGCEATFEPAAFIGPVVQGMMLPGLRLFAVYRVEQPGTPRTVPAGDYGVVFAGEFPGTPPAGPAMVAVTVDAVGRIVSWSSSCGVVEPGEFVDALPVAEFILPPKSEE